MGAWELWGLARRALGLAGGLGAGLVQLAGEQAAWVLVLPGTRRAYHAGLTLLVLLAPLLRLYVSPHAIFANPRNFFHVKLVASAWGWTSLLVAGLLLPLAVGAAGRVGAALRPLCRLAVGAGFWVGARAAFALAEDLTGHCYDPVPGGRLVNALPSKAACSADGHYWTGFAPSAPAFLLTFCPLLVLEEAGVFGRCLARGLRAGPALHALFLFNVALLVLWPALLAATLLWQPPYAPHAAGTATATLCWALAYRGWYRCRWSPGRPGAGLFPLATECA